MLKWLLIPLFVVGAFFFFQSEEKRLKKKTWTLMSRVLADPADHSPIVLLRKTQGIIKHVHFSVHYEIKWKSRSYQNRSQNNLRSDLTAWFRQKPDYKAEIPSKKDLTVSFSEDRKKASVNLSLPVSYKKQKGLCSIKIDWEKEKSWLIHKIQALCQN